MDVLIISNFWHFPEEKSSSRYHSLASMLAARGVKTEVVTSTFYHTKKQQRKISELDIKEIPYRVTLLEECSYPKNVSVKRVLGHRQFAKNVLRYLKERKKPDVIYLFVPPTGLAKKVVKFANDNGIRVIIDVLDLWPEAFAMLLPEIITKPLLMPMRRSVEYAYRNADEVVAVSEAYVRRALSLNRKNAKGHPVFIGTDLAAFDEAAKDAPTLTGRLRPVTMAYIGMLGHSYDLMGVMQAMLRLRERGYDEVEFLVMGDGPLREKFSDFAEKNQLPVRFTGRLPYGEMVKKLVRCDFAVNVLVDKAAQSIINKHADYVSAGIPVINIQKEQEFGNLLEQYGAGYMCALGDTDALADVIYQLSADLELREKMGTNSRRLAQGCFDRNQTYGEILDLIVQPVAGRV